MECYHNSVQHRTTGARSDPAERSPAEEHSVDPWHRGLHWARHQAHAGVLTTLRLWRTWPVPCTGFYLSCSLYPRHPSNKTMVHFTQDAIPLTRQYSYSKSLNIVFANNV